MWAQFRVACVFGGGVRHTYVGSAPAATRARSVLREAGEKSAPGCTKALDANEAESRIAIVRVIAHRRSL